MSGITLMIGTTKGAFLMSSDRARRDWHLTGPHCDGETINHFASDPKRGIIWAASGSKWGGPGVWASRDGGESWSHAHLGHGEREEFVANHPEEAAEYGMEPSPPAPFTGEIDALWSIARVGETLYAGAKPARLFKSEDDGASWVSVDALHNHASRESWTPGGAGLTLHTILGTGQSLWVGISAAGVFASEDGGASWERRNALSNTKTGEATEIFHCVHNMVMASDGRIYQENHVGTYTSQDGGRSWDAIGAGLPTEFGFPITVNPHDPEMIWVIPLQEEGRFPVGGAAKVWRSLDGGQSWAAQDAGLPGKNCFFTVLRQAMATDQQAAPGIYFGTNSGAIFASFDQGESWSEILSHLPTILTVEVMDRES